MAFFGAGHLQSLILISEDRGLPAPVRAANPARPRWRMVHLLVEGCDCSAAIARHLCDRRPIAGVDEVVYVVGGNHHFDWVKNLAGLGFDVQVKDAGELRRLLGTDAGPQLLIEDPTGAIRYRGGYQSSRPGTGLNHPPIGSETDIPQEREILSALRQGGEVEAYPAFGCAGSLVGSNALKRSK